MTASNTTILIRKSVVSGITPGELANGEIAINSADGKLFYSDPIGNILSISNQNTFGVVNANSSLVVASNPTDTLSFVAGDNIRIDADGLNKKITISAATTGVYTDGTFSGDVVAADLTANNSVNIGVNSKLTTTNYDTNSLSQVVVDNFDTTLYRSAKYEVQMTSGYKYHLIELRVVHDGTSVWLAQYGDIQTDGTLGNFDSSISAGVLQLLFTPTNSATNLKIYRNALVI
jgi:hypothetical protein